MASDPAGPVRVQPGELAASIDQLDVAVARLQQVTSAELGEWADAVVATVHDAERSPSRCAGPDSCWDDLCRGADVGPRGALSDTALCRSGGPCGQFCADHPYLVED